jgi:hypothetical protein
MVKGYLFGTIASAVALHVAVSVIAPGDGGTMLALGSLPILLTLTLILGLVSMVAFPMAALLSWPFRRLVFDHPIIGLALAAGVGLTAGAVMTAMDFRVGPGDFWSGSLVGFVYGVAWFLVVRSSDRIASGA